ncbi:receptor-type tyrosine-protein phosphatase R [Paramormyrops kingsleyae]|uniref:receptor-type tyrosine-protein phosphatase R n=1 Tax=Paramormyrops kingsleyae TaxID=1676925 RepID=UPI000CD65AE1|nr:receptor-type tyrosine-protein phosphatase R isoform X1 [Paramormyrops kingsleyae]XP_023682333.1 receptor-type tyrosine-protein phosphatase R isoform X1 [Paramormyrops kingsleyae]XP_023682341.1 receptor-type tyrosine-protein phosphatase R isoform X1 [Paramormyrops kingsleyae]
MPAIRGCLLLACALLQFDVSGCLSGDHGPLMTAHRVKWPVLVTRRAEKLGKTVDLGVMGSSMKVVRHPHHHQLDELHRHPPANHLSDLPSNLPHGQSRARIGKLRPALITPPHFRQAPPEQAAGFLARTEDDVRVENAPISVRHLVTVALQMDVRKLNMSLLRSFREGMAAALDVLPQRVHINGLDERKNGIELYVSSDGPGLGEPLPSREVIRSLNINVLHRSLGPFGVTGVTSEKNVLQGQHERDNVWTKEGFYAVVIFLTIFVIVVTCLMVLYRLKEKVELSDRQFKEPPGQELHLTPIQVHAPQPQAKPAPSMVRAEPATKPASAAPPELPRTPCPATSEPRPIPSPSPSPFRMKPSAGLQERRGSNVSLVLDMSVLGSVEPLSSTGATPRERVAQEYLQAASRTLSRQQLRGAVLNTQNLHAEFVEIPMNFVDPKEVDIPTHGTKNRYRTILPNPHSRVILKTKNANDPLSSYINANYIRGFLGFERAYIATQGPMINTVNDFWQMAWQESCPVIVMITKLKEKNEKCVLYWPEKRGIYGKVEVLVDGVRESEHYTVRHLTLQQGGQSHSLKHYWYTSWPDHKTPDSAQPLLQLMAEVEEDRQASGPRGPVIVHCSAGIGRTGCFIATTIGCRQLQEDGTVDVLGIVCKLRVDRGGMIQTGEQYEFVHHALSLYESRLSADAGQ